MTITVEWPSQEGSARTFPDCTQAQVNRMINYIQRLRDDAGLTTQVKITVTD